MILSGLAIGIPLFIMTQVTSFWTDTLGLPSFQYLYFNMAMFVLGLVAMVVISAVGGDTGPGGDARRGLHA